MRRVLGEEPEASGRHTQPCGQELPLVARRPGRSHAGSSSAGRKVSWTPVGKGPGRCGFHYSSPWGAVFSWRLNRSVAKDACSPTSTAPHSQAPRHPGPLCSLNWWLEVQAHGEAIRVGSQWCAREGPCQPVWFPKVLLSATSTPWAGHPVPKWETSSPRPPSVGPSEGLRTPTFPILLWLPWGARRSGPFYLSLRRQTAQGTHSSSVPR